MATNNPNKDPQGPHNYGHPEDLLEAFARDLVLEAYLEEAGDPDDAKQVKDQITGLWASLSRLN